jgi:uncharacterized protein (TIGR02271 family)
MTGRRVTEPMHEEARIPIVEEVATVTKRSVETENVTVRTVVDEHRRDIVTNLVSEDIVVERRAVERAVDTAPPPREDGDTVIVSIVEERAVVTKQLYVVEEVLLRRVSTVAEVRVPTTLRSMRAIVEGDRDAS